MQIKIFTIPISDDGNITTIEISSWPTISSFNVDSEGATGWDLDNDNCSFDFEYYLFAAIA